MKIDLKEITIKTLTDGFVDDDEQGVVAYPQVKASASAISAWCLAISTRP